MATASAVDGASPVLWCNGGTRQNCSGGSPQSLLAYLLANDDREPAILRVNTDDFDRASGERGELQRRG